MNRGALISDCGQYRYWLTRVWGDPYTPRVCWVGCNPSTADHQQDDPTIRRCVSFSKAWGFNSLVVVNLFSYRATKPEALWQALEEGVDIIGPDNGKWLSHHHALSDLTVAAWGAHLTFDGGGIPEHIRDDLAGFPLVSLGTTKDGHPRHPLYVKGDTDLVAWP